ncbi:MAG: RnfABCDGE type electron transport complex subunit D, partial [Candidatus Saccharimonadales bacterium]
MFLSNIDYFLNRITMYRLTLYGLLIIWGWGLAGTITGFLHYSPIDYVVTGAIIFLLCVGVNAALARLYHAPANIDSTYITALILMLIIAPSKPLASIWFIAGASALAIASKYLVVIGKKHLFNPAAFGVVVAAIFTHEYASWWVGTLWMAPAVAIAGFLIVRKIQRWDAVLAFWICSLTLMLIRAVILNQRVFSMVWQLVIDTPWLFLAMVMLTEPSTMPHRRRFRVAYGVLVGVLFAPFFNVLGFFFSPELALLVGNAASYVVSPKEKLILRLKQKSPAARSIHSFVFTASQKFTFEPGQYMEWTLGHEKSDQRGIRRYFTVASSPTEQDVIIGVKFYEHASSYKKTLDALKPGDTIVAAQPAGDFVLPRSRSQKLAFLAGGIGVTPFRSMAKY